jgi:neopullulanase
MPWPVRVVIASSLFLVACGATVLPVGPERSCASVIRWAGTESVTLRGEWAGFSRQQLTKRSDGTLEWRDTLEPRASGYGYSFERTDGGRVLDPTTSFTRWVGQEEHSRLFVPDCKLPLIEVTSFSATAQGALSLEANVLRGAGGKDLAAPKLRLDDTEPAVAFEAKTGRLQFSATGLTPGKHTVTITLADSAGAQAEAVQLPFWVEAAPFKWEEAILYFVFTDRFRNGDPSNDRPTPSVNTMANYQGGDFKGVTQAIEEGYFDRLGVRALWLSPPDINPDGAFEGSYGQKYTGYHGYWPSKPRTVQPRFGTMADLKALTKAAHARGIRVLTDLVLNHVHSEHPYVKDHRDDGWFNVGNGCVCGTNGCGWEEKPLVCSFTDYLPDYNWRSTAMADQFAADAMWWLREADLDGFRLDAVKHLDQVGGRTINGELAKITAITGTDYYLVGETFVGSDGRALIKKYVSPNELDGQFDFPLYWPVVQAFGRGDSMVQVDEAVQENERFYAPGTLNSPFLGNHDVARFASIAAGEIQGDANGQSWGPNRPGQSIDRDEPFDRLRYAFTFVLTQPGVPLIYYGDEIGLPGAGDPDNRRFMKWSGLSGRESGLLTFMQKLGTARRNSDALRFGTRQTLFIERDVYVFARSTPTSTAIVAINRGDERQVTIAGRMGVRLTGRFTDALSGRTIDVGADGRLVLPARTSLVLLPL